MVTFVIASHDDKIFNDNIAKSKIYKDKKYNFVVAKDYPKCTIGYNKVADKITTPYVAYMHHDLELSDEFEKSLLHTISILDWNQVGVVGVAGVAKSGHYVGSCKSYGVPYGNIKLNEDSDPFAVNVLDELFLLKKNDGYHWDEKIPHNHMYGPDVCLHYRNKQKQVLVGPIMGINHNANRKRNPMEGIELQISGKYIASKYYHFLPIRTTCVLITGN